MLVLHDQGRVTAGEGGGKGAGDRYYVKCSSPISKVSSQWDIMTEKQHFIKRPVFMKKDSIIILCSKV